MCAFTVLMLIPSCDATCTTAGADVFLGNAVSDSAALSGTATQPANPVINLTGTAGAPAAGTITFKLYGPDDCSTLAYTSATVPVSGNATYNTPAPQFVPEDAGEYHWVAVYSGSSPNTNGTTHNAGCTDEDEDVMVNTVPSTMSTSQTWVPNDSATVSAPAGGALDGSVSFTLYGSSDCTGDALYTVEVPVAGSSPRTVSTVNTEPQSASGSFSWLVGYDSENAAQRDIAAACEETSALTVDNGDPVSSQ